MARHRTERDQEGTRRYIGLSLALSLLVYVLAAPVSASTFRAASFETLYEEATDVVRARVTRVTERVARRTQGLTPVRRTSFEVLEVFKGQSRPFEIEYEEGLTPEGRTRRRLGTPVFRAREEVVLFVVREELGPARVVALEQGVFRMRRDLDAQVFWVRHLDEVHLVGDASIPDRLTSDALRSVLRSLRGSP